MNCHPINAEFYLSSPQWKSLKQINVALDNAHMELASGKKIIVIEGEIFSFQDVIDRVYDLRPSFAKYSSRMERYLSVAKKLKKIDLQIPAQQKSLCKRILNLFACCGCTASCREKRILVDDAALTADGLIEWFEDREWMCGN